MDSSTKAILMAGGILIGVILISLFMYALTSFREFSTRENEKRFALEILEYNSQFDAYVPNKRVEAYQIYNLLGKAIDVQLDDDSPFSLAVNGMESSSELKAQRETMFHYTDALSGDYLIKSVQYTDGYVSAINFE